ncbi:MAG: carboxypeptidase-like regulatory domain-containing protein [Saprospiraceae bacterium]
MTTFYKNASLVFFLCFSVYGFAQTTITGKVVDKNDGTPLPYVYLKIDKIALGTVTEGDGKFRINIPKKYDTYTITFSYVGYEDLQLSVTDFKTKNGGHFAMASATNLLTEVVVKPKKMLRAKALLRKVIKKIPQNYASFPIMITGYYRETMKENGVYIKYTDAACHYYSLPYRNEKYKRKDYQSVYDFLNSNGTFSIDFSNTLHRVHFHHQTLKGEQANIVKARSSSNLSKRRFYANIEGGPLSLFARNRVKYQQSFLGKKRNGDFDYTISEAQDKDGSWLYVLDFNTKTTREFLESIATPSNNRQWRVANKHKLLRQSGRNNQPFIPPFSLLRNSKNASIIHYASIF